MEYEHLHTILYNSFLSVSVLVLVSANVNTPQTYSVSLNGETLVPLTVSAQCNHARGAIQNSVTSWHPVTLRSFISWSSGYQATLIVNPFLVLIVHLRVIQKVVI